MKQFTTIVGTQRSGTTVTRAIMGSHPHVHTFGEVFLPRDHHMRENYYNFLRERCNERPFYAIPTEENQRELFQGYLARLARMSGESTQVVIDCKTQFLKGGLNLGGLCGNHPFLLTLMKDYKFKFVGIRRANKLGMYVSQILSARTRVWATKTPGEIPDRTVYVPTTRLLERLNNMVGDDTEIRNLLSRTDTFEMVDYEVFLSGGSGVNRPTLQRLSTLMGVSNEFVPHPPYKKIGLPLREAIRNFDEVVKALGPEGAKQFVDPYL